MENSKGKVYTVPASASVRSNLNGSNSGYPNVNSGDRDSSNLNLVPVNTRATIFKKKHFYKRLSIALAVLSLIFLIALIVTVHLYLCAKRLATQLCTSEECLRSAANLRSSMDPSVDPCDNFYEFACGRWTEEHPNHGWYRKFSNFEVIDERISIAAIAFLESEEPIEPDEPLPVKQSRDLYQSCMDTETTNNIGYTVIYKILKDVELPEIPTFFAKPEDEWDDFKFDILKIMTNIQKTISLDTFIQFSVEPDIYNRSTYVIYLGSTIGSSPLPSPLNGLKKNFKSSKNSKSSVADDESIELQEKYDKAFKKTMQEIIRVVLTNKTTDIETTLIETAVNRLFNMSRDVTELASNNASTSVKEITVISATIDELQNITNEILITNGFKANRFWFNYMAMIFDNSTNVTLDFTKDLIHFTPDELPFILGIVLYLEKTPDYMIELYLWYSAVYAMIISTTDDIIQYIYKESSSVSPATPTYRSRSLDCAELVISFMGIAVSYGIADKNFMQQTKPKVEQMINDIKEAFVVRVNTLTWMDADTKRATLEKSDEMISLIGFPEWLMNKTMVEDYYANITIKNNTFLQNLVNIVKSYTPHVLSAIRTENERTWRTDPTTVNAYNYFGDNSINIPMAILSHPLYHLGLEVLNYGSIGSILGHELTHGFDNTGRKFDKYGNVKEWWTNTTIETFENKTDCFVEQYENFTIPLVDVQVNGKLTLGENLADNGGIHHAFLAYQRYLGKYGPEKTLPGFEQYTNNQLFFIAFGSIWCETRDTAEILAQLQFDEHCPSSIRVQGTLQNSVEFSNAFKCPKGSKMNPNRPKCRIW